jgi:hypothetical protein
MISEEEKERLLHLMNDMSDAEREKAISVFDSFVRWIKRVDQMIYEKVKDQLKKVWDWIREVFA